MNSMPQQIVQYGNVILPVTKPFFPSQPAPVYQKPLLDQQQGAVMQQPIPQQACYSLAPDLRIPPIPSHNPPSTQVPQQSQPVMPPHQPPLQTNQHELQTKYKTKLCKHYAKTKSCQLAQFCSFAHGKAELRRRDDPLPNEGCPTVGLLLNNYKTQLCRNMLETGVCQFGDTCVYAHHKDELRHLTDPVPSQAPPLFVVKKRTTANATTSTEGLQQHNCGGGRRKPGCVGEGRDRQNFPLP